MSNQIAKKLGEIKQYKAKLPKPIISKLSNQIFQILGGVHDILDHYLANARYMKLNQVNEIHKLLQDTKRNFSKKQLQKKRQRAKSSATGSNANSLLSQSITPLAHTPRGQSYQSNDSNNNLQISVDNHDNNSSHTSRSTSSLIAATKRKRTRSTGKPIKQRQYITKAQTQYSSFGYPKHESKTPEYQPIFPSKSAELSQMRHNKRNHKRRGSGLKNRMRLELNKSTPNVTHIASLSAPKTLKSNGKGPRTMTNDEFMEIANMNKETLVAINKNSKKRNKSNNNSPNNSPVINNRNKKVAFSEIDDDMKHGKMRRRVNKMNATMIEHDDLSEKVFKSKKQTNNLNDRNNKNIVIEDYDVNDEFGNMHSEPINSINIEDFAGPIVVDKKRKYSISEYSDWETDDAQTETKKSRQYFDKLSKKYSKKKKNKKKKKKKRKKLEKLKRLALEQMKSEYSVQQPETQPQSHTHTHVHPMKLSKDKKHHMSALDALVSVLDQDDNNNNNNVVNEYKENINENKNKSYKIVKEGYNERNDEFEGDDTDTKVETHINNHMQNNEVKPSMDSPEFLEYFEKFMEENSSFYALQLESLDGSDEDENDSLNEYEDDGDSDVSSMEYDDNKY